MRTSASRTRALAFTSRDVSHSHHAIALTTRLGGAVLAAGVGTGGATGRTMGRTGASKREWYGCVASGGRSGAGCCGAMSGVM